MFKGNTYFFSRIGTLEWQYPFSAGILLQASSRGEETVYLDVFAPTPTIDLDDLDDRVFFLVSAFWFFSGREPVTTPTNNKLSRSIHPLSYTNYRTFIHVDARKIKKSRLFSTRR
jgi:hypothetical protein